MRRFFLIGLAASIALTPLSACDGGDLPAAYRDLEVPVERLASAEPLHVFYAVREGVRGTAMASWKALDEDQTWDAVAYVTSIAGSGR